MSKRYFHRYLLIEKWTDSNILAASEEWVVKGLIEIKRDDLFAQEEVKSPNLQLVLVIPLFDQTLMSKVRPINMADLEEEEDDEDNVPLIWKLRKQTSDASSIPNTEKD